MDAGRAMVHLCLRETSAGAAQLRCRSVVVRLFLAVGIVGALVGASGIVHVSPAVAAPSKDGEPETLDDLFDLFDVDAVSSDFVVVIDSSGSMSEGDPAPYTRVQSAFGQLVDAIPFGDHLSLITFNSDTDLEFNDVLDDDDSRAAAIGSLPKEVEGGSTDIGLAIETALDRLERPDGEKVQTLIVLTDGAHAPPPGSLYPAVGSPAWSDLRARADTLRSLHETQVLGIAVSPAGEQGTALLRNVFGNPQLISLSGDQLADFFLETVRKSQLLRLQSLIATELEHTVIVGSRQTATLEERIETEIEVRSEYEKLPVTVSIDTVSATDSEGRPVRASPTNGKVTVLPGETRTLGVLLEPEIEDIGFQFPPVTEERDFDISVTASVVVEPNALLRTVVDLPLTQTVEGSQLVEADRTFGWTIAQIVIRAVLLLFGLLILWLLYRHFIQVPKLVGGFQILNSGLPEEKSYVRLKGKRMEVGGSQIPGAGAAKLEAFTKRRRRGRVYVSVERPPFYVVDDRGREKQVSDVTEVKLNTYRLGSGRIRYRVRPRERTTTTQPAATTGVR